jgi:hypothetical protein
VTPSVREPASDSVLRPEQDPQAPVPEEPKEEMIMHLQRDQTVSQTSRPVPRVRLGPRTAASLWALRLFVVVVGAMVIYTFIVRLH